MPMKMEQTECSEKSAYKIQMPGNYPEESIKYLIPCLQQPTVRNYEQVKQSTNFTIFFPSRFTLITSKITSIFF